MWINWYSKQARIDAVHITRWTYIHAWFITQGCFHVNFRFLLPVQLYELVIVRVSTPMCIIVPLSSRPYYERCDLYTYRDTFTNIKLEEASRGYTIVRHKTSAVEQNRQHNWPGSTDEYRSVRRPVNTTKRSAQLSKGNPKGEYDNVNRNVLWLWILRKFLQTV